MPGEPSGFLGKLAAERPLLATGVLAIGLTALCVLGVAESADPMSADVILRFFISAAAVTGAPIMLAGLAPSKPAARTFYLAFAAVPIAALFALAYGAASIPLHLTPPRLLVDAGVGLFVYLAALAPITRGALRLGLLAPLAAMLGAAGGVGYFALENILDTSLLGASVAIALAAGVCAGVGIGADFAHYFARGMAPKQAAAAAGHAAIAPAAFSILAAAAFAAVTTFKLNFGAVDWRIFGGGGAVALLAAISALIMVSGSLALTKPNEEIAVIENRRRQRFAESWRPFRNRLPVTTALAASAIAGVFVVIAAFEAGVPEVKTLLAFLLMMLIASGITFVSIRTSLLIVVILFTSTVLSGYLYEVMGLTLPSAPDRFAALSLAAIALSQLTVSWRNAGDIWRNARDIAQNAMSDGLRRFAVALGVGAAALVASAHAFSWETGVQAAGYFSLLAGVSLILAPVTMIALSAQTQA